MDNLNARLDTHKGNVQVFERNRMHISITRSGKQFIKDWFVNFGRKKFSNTNKSQISYDLNHPFEHEQLGYNEVVLDLTHDTDFDIQQLACKIQNTQDKTQEYKDFNQSLEDEIELLLENAQTKYALAA